jgi:hypothetical protein
MSFEIYLKKLRATELAAKLAAFHNMECATLVNESANHAEDTAQHIYKAIKAMQ